MKSQQKKNAQSDVKKNGETHLVAAKTPKVPKGARVRRSAVPLKANYSLNLWSIMKNCIGKDLSKIPMPVSYVVCNGRLDGGNLICQHLFVMLLS